MKAEINNENKAKFFALYWRQQVLSHKDYECGESYGVNGVMIDISHDGYYLNIKSLSQISDENAKILMGWPLDCDLGFKELIGYFSDGLSLEFTLEQLIKQLKPFHYDYLRSEGFAIPWMGLSINELIEAGWIKLTEV